MQGLRRQGRSYALQLLYQIDISKSADEAAQALFWEHSHASRKAQAFADELVQAYLSERERIDGLLTASLEHWKLSRLPSIVRNVLRLAVSEMEVIGREPYAVVINEALELTRTFMDEESARFVNSVLEKVHLGPGAVPEPPPEAEKAVSAPDGSPAETPASNAGAEPVAGEDPLPDK